MAPHTSSFDRESLSPAKRDSDEVEQTKSNECEPEHTVAIVGMGCRWPGGVSTPSQLWDLLAKGRSGYRDFDDSKFSIPGFYHPNPQRPGSTPARGGHLLQDDPKHFDHAFFGITPTETLTLDPQHRKLLEVVYEAFENAGEPWDRFSGSRTGVFVGNFTADHNIMQSQDTDNLLPYATTGGSTSILSNRINYIFNLHGPSLTLDTACSSSLYALHLAVNAIKNGDCDSAIVGAGNLILSPDLHLSLSKLGALSPTAVCHVFDAAADGYSRGEGFAAFYLKRTSDAVAGAYPIRSVIRGTAINSNGRTAGITHPSAEGQVEVIRQAYATANLDPSLTGYFEAHGTGTQVGDPMEVNAIGQVFSQYSLDSELRIGSIKSNIGHTEAASGMAGIMKTVLAMEHGLIPPTIGISQLSPRINFKEARVRPVTRLEPWPSNRLKRVSINSFGYGGANGHCILDDVSVALPGYSNKTARRKSPFPDTHKSNRSSRRMLLLLFSAKEENALRDNISAIAVAMNNYDLADVAYTLSSRSSIFNHRTYRIVEAGHSNARLDLKTATTVKHVTGRKPRIGLVFTGQGAQWEGMGAELLEYAVFRNSIANQDLILSSLSNKPSWSIHDIISGKLKGRLHEPMVSQTVCTAIQVALIDLLRFWRIDWTASVGHSSGEIAAAYAARLITYAEAITIAYCRGFAVASNTKSGLMLAVGLGKDEIELYLDNFRYNLRIAAINSPKSVTVSGDSVSVMELYEILLAKGVFAKLLQTGQNAYHSHHMASIGDIYVELLRKSIGEIIKDGPDSLKEGLRKAEWFSSATPELPRHCVSLDMMYWRLNLQAPVQFSQAIENMVMSSAAAVDVLIEVGPHSALKSSLREILSHVGKDVAYVPTLRKHEDGMRSMMDMCGNLFCVDATLDFTIVNSTDEVDDNGKLLNYQHGMLCVDLPRYTYNYGPVIHHENRLSRENRLRKYLKHDLLGAKQLGVSGLRPSWRNVLRGKDVPWLSHHKLVPQIVFPASAYICMAIEAANQFFQGESGNSPAVGFTIRDLSLNSALVIPDSDTGVEVVLDLDASKSVQSKDKATWYGFRVSTVAAATDSWTEHCSGIIRPNIQKHISNRLSDAMDRRIISASKWYKKFRKVGLDYGDTFRGLSELTSDPLSNIAQAKVALQTTADLFNGPESPYILHPAALDMCAQLALIAVHGGQVEQMSTAYVPSFVGELSVWTPATHDQLFGTATAKGVRRGLRGAYAQAHMLSMSGEVLLDISDMRCTAYSGEQAKGFATRASGSPYMRLAWKPYLEKMSREQARLFFPPVEITHAMEDTFADIDRLASLMVKEISERFGSRMSEHHLPDHFQKFLGWARRMAAFDCPPAKDAAATTSIDRARLINNLCAKLQDIVEVPLLKRIFDNLDDILSGTKSSLELVRQDDSHSQMYFSGLGISAAYVQLEHVVDLLAHANPSMNILEIGAGTGGATRVALKTLGGETYLRRYRTYTFTDVSSGYFLEARKEFSKFHALDFGVLDIEQAPSSQGYEAKYDLVIASCSIHVTKDINLTLCNAHSMLKPGGKLLILECTQPKITHGLVLGTLPDYWVGTEATRMDSPFLSVAEWHTMLSAAGFSGINIELDDYPQPYTMISTLLSSAGGVEALPLTLNQSLSPSETTPVQVVSFLGTEPTSSIQKINRSHFGDPLYLWHEDGKSLPDQSRIIVLYDSSSPLTSSGSRYGFVKELLSKSKSVLWINVTDECPESYPYAGVITGLLRVLASEYPSIAYASIDIHKADLQNDVVIQQVLEMENKLLFGDISSNVEYQIADGVLSISSLVPDEQLNDRAVQEQNNDTQPLPIGDQSPFAASFATPGILSSAYFEEDAAFWKPLNDDQLEIRTMAVGLNWKDLAVSAGRLDLDNFSSECSGIVTKIGKAVTDFQVGEKVFGFSKGKFGNYMRCHSSLMQHMYTENFADMAAIPIVYMTALYSLSYLARVEPGEKVLIQSASGGLGIAALNLARYLRADIWVTVGTEEKRAFVRDTYSIPDSQIFSSRRPPDIAEVKQATGGAGINVILSTSSSDSFNEWLRCLAPGGRFVDVGRVDVQNHASMALEVFKRNATLSSFDLTILIENNPVFCSRLLTQVTEMLRSGTLSPIIPIKTFDISHLVPALLYLSRGAHIGKVVVTYEDSTSLINIVPSKPKVRFDSEAKYILVGGLGGLGRSIIAWMTERGAKNFVDLSRSTPHNSASLFMSSIASQGCTIEHICCDVTQLNDVEAAIAEASQSGVIKGIVHTAVSLKDNLFDSLSSSDWQRGLAVKVDGTVNLHKASLHLPLDFFVLVSSIVAQIALPTQATYCASNNFQNKFARYRRSQGLPATAVELGLIEEAGHLGQNSVYHNAAMRNGLYHTSEHGLLQHLEYVFAGVGGNETLAWKRYDPYADAHLITSLDPARLLEVAREQRETATKEVSFNPRWHSDARFSHIVQAMENLAVSDQDSSTKINAPSNTDQDAQTALEELSTLIKTKDIEAATLLITKSIVVRMADMFFVSADSIDSTKSVTAYGMDSLIAAELRNWFVITYKCTISLLKLLDTATSIEELADIVIKSRVEASKA